MKIYGGVLMVLVTIAYGIGALSGYRLAEKPECTECEVCEEVRVETVVETVVETSEKGSWYKQEITYRPREMLIFSGDDSGGVIHQLAYGETVKLMDYSEAGDFCYIKKIEKTDISSSEGWIPCTLFEDLPASMTNYWVKQ